MGNVGVEFGLMRQVANSAKQILYLSFNDRELEGRGVKGGNGVYIR